jgi:hypothetical protein
MKFILAFGGLLLLYGLFNYSLTGSFFPNTFYAKQLEYAQVLESPLYSRLAKIFLVPLSGMGVLLIPGFIYSIVNSIQKRNWWTITALLWTVGYGIIYAVRLPMTYQHGRYLIPLIPVYLLIGVIGTISFVNSGIKDEVKRTKIFNLIGVGFALVSIVFAVSGEIALINDMNTIEILMVQPALWINKNTESDAVIAVHDIGAMGYFGDRKLIDLAGLIQPEIIPIIGNDQEIEKYLVQSKADYLVILKDWYAELENFGTIKKTYTYKMDGGVEIAEIRELK